MDNKEFKKMFGSTAEKYGFSRLTPFWFKESSECIVVLELQKSNYGNYYYLRIKPFVQGAWGKKHEKSKDVFKKCSGFMDGPNRKYEELFNLELPMEDETRRQGIEGLFKDFLNAHSEALLSIANMEQIYGDRQYYLLSNFRVEIHKLLNEKI